MPTIPHGRILDVLEEQDSLLMVVKRLPALGDRLSIESAKLQRLSINIGDTVAKLQEADSNELTLLVHAMSPSSIQSIIQGTVAYDTARGAAKWYPAPTTSNARTPGVYVIGLQSQPDGSFLSKSEILKVIDGIDDYIRGCEIIDQVAATSRDPIQREKVRWVGRVDGAYAAHTWQFNEEPKFNRKSDDVRGLRATADMLQQRCLGAVGGNIRQKQSPLYTGCSRHLNERMSNYQLKNHLYNVNKPLGIVISIAKLIGAPLTPVVRVAIRTWQHTQLAAAEQLVLSLADGLIGHRGFNKKEAGKNSPANTVAELEMAQRFVMTRAGTLGDNLTATLTEIDQRIHFLRLLPKVDGQIVVLKDEAERLRKALPEVKPDGVSFEELRARMIAQMRRNDVELQHQRSQIKANEVYFNVLATTDPELAAEVKDKLQGSLGGGSQSLEDSD